MTRDGLLEPEQLDGIEAHIESCAPCRTALGRMTAESAPSTEDDEPTPGRGGAVLGMTPDPLPSGTTWPDLSQQGYRIERLLGAGGFGEVWRAQDLNLPRTVALKTLKVSDRDDRRECALEALRKDAHLLTDVDHPNVVRVHAWLHAHDQHYLVMQYVSGGSLGDLLKREGPLDWQRAVRYVADVGEGLVEVHSRGIVHRDVKPANMLWDEVRDEALLTDFGVGARLSDPVSVAGSLAYMAPETFEGRLSPALDVYSLAASLFHLTTGVLPFRGPRITDLREQIARGLPDPDTRCSALPEPLERLIRGGLSVDPLRRPGLREYVSTLRGSLNQLLADSLTLPHEGRSGHASVDLRLQVSRLTEDGRYGAVATTRARPGPLTRDMRRVPRPPDQVRLRTGDRVRIEVVADREGYLTVFNIGPTGTLNLLYPDGPAGAPPQLVPGRQPLHVLDVEMTPPAGKERLFALWSRQPLPVATGNLVGLGKQVADSRSHPYRATRDMRRVQQSLHQLTADDRQVVVLELENVC